MIMTSSTILWYDIAMLRYDIAILWYDIAILDIVVLQKHTQEMEEMRESSLGEEWRKKMGKLRV